VQVRVRRKLARIDGGLPKRGPRFVYRRACRLVPEVRDDLADVFDAGSDRKCHRGYLRPASSRRRAISASSSAVRRAASWRVKYSRTVLWRTVQSGRLRPRRTAILCSGRVTAVSWHVTTSSAPSFRHASLTASNPPFHCHVPLSSFTRKFRNAA